MTRTLFFSLATLALPAFAQAAILANYPFTGALPASTDTDLATVAQPFVVQGGGGFSTQTNAFKRTTETQGSDLAGAIDNDDYFSFTVVPLPSGEIDLTELAFQYGGTNDQSAAVGPFTANFAVLSSVGGFTAASPVLGTFSRSVEIGTGSTPALNSASIDLAAPAF